MSSDLRALWASAGGRVPDDWNVVPLESLLRDSKSIAVGVMYPGPETPGGIPLIKVGDIKDGAIIGRPAFCISPETNHEYRRTQLQGDELLVTLVGNPGECVVVQPHMTGWNPARAIAVMRLSDPTLRTYLKTVLESRAGKHLIDAVLNTTVQKTLNLKDIKRLPIPLPSLPAIEGITLVAETLSARITLLRETNATLEAIAQALFKSWFVDFDPVRAKMEGRVPEGMDEATAALFPDSFEETELGEVPRGWKPGCLGDVAKTFKKAVTPSDMHTGVNYVGLEHIPRKSLSLTEWGDAAELESNKTIFNEGDILFGKLRPYFHKVVAAPISGVCSTDILVCQPTQDEHRGLAMMYLFSDALISYADRLSNGAKMPRVNWNDLAKFPISLPSLEVSSLYTNAIEPLVSRMSLNIHAARTLATIRDTLLPRLIGGQIRLPEAQSRLEEALL